MSGRLRLLWLTADPPILGTAAAQDRWWNLLARLAPRHDVTLLTLHSPRNPPRATELPPGLLEVHTVARREPVVDDPLALLPAGVRYAYTHPAYTAAVAERIGAVRFDVVQVEYLETMNLIPASIRPTVLTVHQIGFAADGQLWRAGGRLRGAPWALYRHLRNLDWELRMLARARHVVTMSPEDAARLHRFVPDARISVSPVGVDCRAFVPTDASPTLDWIFVGNYHHPPNVDAVRWLATTVLPRVGHRLSGAVAGREMPEALRAFLVNHGIDVLGPLDDVRPHLARARLVVAPVRFGTGMRGKVLEALAMGRPVVTTTLGAEGLGARVGQQLMVADDATGFAAAMSTVLGDAARARHLGAAGRALAEERFDWDRIAADHERIYDEALGHADDPPGLPPDRSAPLARAARRLPVPCNGLLGAVLLAQRGVRWYLRAQR